MAMLNETNEVTGSTLGQDTAVATGVAPAYMTPPEDITTVRPGTTFVDPTKGTVAGQLSTLLAAESPYIEQARRRGEEQAARRGMLTTSISAGAAEREAIAAALPIAQQDAETYARVLGRQQEQEFAAGQSQLAREHEQTIQERNLESKEAMQTQAEQWQAGQAELNRTFQAAQAGLDRDQQIKLQGMQGDLQKDMQELIGEQERILQDARIDADQAKYIINASSQIMQNYQAATVGLLGDPTFLELSGADMQRTLNNMRTMAKNQVTFLGNLTQVDMSKYLAAAFPALTY